MSTHIRCARKLLFAETRSEEIFCARDWTLVRQISLQAVGGNDQLNSGICMKYFELHSQFWKKNVVAVMLGLHRLAPNSQLTSWKILDFLVSWAVVQFLSSDCKLAFTSISGTTEPQRPALGDTLAIALWLICDALRPSRVTCVTRPNLRPIYDCAEWHTRQPSELWPTCKDLWPKEHAAASWVFRKWNWQVPRPVLTVKRVHWACRFQLRVGPSYCEYPGVTYDQYLSPKFHSSILKFSFLQAAKIHWFRSHLYGPILQTCALS